MSIRAGFAEIDITPELGTKKAGWMQDLPAEKILDPLFAKVAIFETGTDKIAFIALDLLSIRWTQVNEIRNLIEEKYGFPSSNIMISATHNHAGPAIAKLAPVPRQEAYTNSLTQKCVALFGMGLEQLEEAELGRNFCYEFNASFNRRIVKRDGTTQTHMQFKKPDALHIEGPIDPELSITVARNKSGKIIGSLVNFTCHPTHHGGSTEISAGYPGALTDQLKKQGIPVSLFLNGAYGNIHTANPIQHINAEKEQVGELLANDISAMLPEIEYSDDLEVSSVSESIPVDYRNITDDEFKGRVVGAQRFRDTELYEGFIADLKQQIASGKKTYAEIQSLQLGNQFFVSVPAEYFVEFQLQIKAATHPKDTQVVGSANGMIGYVPTKDAFSRGGYETTLGPPSRMAHDTGDKIADTAIKIIKNQG